MKKIWKKCLTRIVPLFNNFSIKGGEKMKHFNKNNKNCLFDINYIIIFILIITITVACNIINKVDTRTNINYESMILDTVDESDN